MWDQDRIGSLLLENVNCLVRPMTMSSTGFSSVQYIQYLKQTSTCRGSPSTYCVIHCVQTGRHLIRKQDVHIPVNNQYKGISFFPAEGLVKFM